MADARFRRAGGGPAAGALIAAVRAYRLLLSPWLGNACRFEPTCSHYAIEALQRHGAMIGARLAAGRLLRCHPWCAGGHDPVPDAAPGLFTGLLSRLPRRPAPTPAAPQRAAHSSEE